MSEILAISHPGLLPSAACKASAFPSGFPKGYPNGHNYTFFGAQSHSLHSCFARLRTLLSKLALGRPYWPAGYALAKWNFRSAIRFISQCQGKPCKEKLTGCTILPNVRASSTEGYMPFGICDHPLGNNIEFHPALRKSQRFGFIWTRPVALLGFLIGPFAWPHAVADQILSLALDRESTEGMLA